MAREKWDRRYLEAEAGALFGRKPSEFLARVAGQSWFDAKTALMLADGDGRNGRYLARLGLDVTAVDFSNVATQNASEMDRTCGVEVERIVADLAEWVPQGEGLSDFAALIFLQCEAAVRDRAIATALRALKPGGMLLLEGFAVAGRTGGAANGPSSGEGAGSGDTSGKEPELAPGPRQECLRYDRALVNRLLSGSEVVIDDSGQRFLQEGEKHRGCADVIRLVVRKGL